MAKRELASRYAGTIGGPIWAIAQPLATLAVFWFVFAVGFKAQGPGGTPFVLYFLAGYLPWLFFSEVLNTSAGSIVTNSYLVKKTVFPTEILPLVHVVSSTVTHVVFILLFVGLLLVMGEPFPWLLPQVAYYYLCMTCFALGLAWLFASLHVFSRDIGQILAVALNLWFWMTPVVWSTAIVPEKLKFLITLNPLFYVVTGYRDSLIYNAPLWQHPGAALRFWVIVIPCLLVGAQVFRRLKPDFADTL